MSGNANNKFTYLLNRLREKLWFKPLIMGIFSIAMVMISKAADTRGVWELSSTISVSSLDKLLSIMASTMMMVATFSVGSMLSAYSSASKSASPRAFRLLIADDSSQHALSVFVGAFIFSIVGLVSVDNDLFGDNGILVLFGFTLMVFAIVIIVLVRWMDRIARLGRMNNTLNKVEAATAKALTCYAVAPCHNALPLTSDFSGGHRLTSNQTGYVKHIDMEALQKWAAENHAEIQVAVLPGNFVTPGRTLAQIKWHQHRDSVSDTSEEPPSWGPVEGAFKIGKERMYDDDPRFGLVVLSQIAARALSPAVNDPGTAIDVIGVQVRLLIQWASVRRQYREDENTSPKYDRVRMGELSVDDLFDDAFTAIARDGKGYVEVLTRLLKGLAALKSVGDSPDMDRAADQVAGRVLFHGREGLSFEGDLAQIRRLADLDKQGQD